MPTTKTAWKSTETEPPPEGEIVNTKIDDEKGCRNERPLKRRGRLWFVADSSTCVYYTPTHWSERA